MLAFARLHARKLIWLLLMLALFWRWDPAVHPLAAAEPLPVPGARVELGTREIFERMVAVYSAAQSYRDRGVVRTTWSGWPYHTSQRPFDTAFVRGGRLRFGYTNQDGRSLLRLMLHGDDQMVIWGTLDSASLWWTIGDGRVEHSNLSSALGSAYGVSGRSSGTIPGLLLPGTISGGVDEPDESKPVAVEAIQGHDCYRLALKCDREAGEAWIDRESFLLRRVRLVSEQDGKTVVATTAYDPEINVDIPDEVFRFEPPK